MEESTLITLVQKTGPISEYHGKMFFKSVRIYYYTSNCGYTYHLDRIFTRTAADNELPIFILPSSDLKEYILSTTPEEGESSSIQNKACVANTAAELYQAMSRTEELPITVDSFLEMCADSGIFDTSRTLAIPESTIPDMFDFSHLGPRQPISLEEAYSSRSRDQRLPSPETSLSRHSSQEEEELRVNSSDRISVRQFLLGIRRDRALSHRTQRRFPVDADDFTTYLSVDYDDYVEFDLTPSQSTRSATSSFISTNRYTISDSSQTIIRRAEGRTQIKRKRFDRKEKDLNDFNALKRAQHSHKKKFKGKTEKPTKITAKGMTCKICMTTKINSVMVPCGHACACSNCCFEISTKTESSQWKCPMCRKTIILVLPFYI